MNTVRVPTMKQVQKLEDKYNLLGLRLERAKIKNGYKRGTTGDIQAKKGAAFGEFYRAKEEFENAGNTYVYLLSANK